METKNINLFVFDSKDNFDKSKNNLGSEGSDFKKIICIEDANEFQKEFSLLGEQDLVYMVVHVFFTDKINGIKRFVASRIKKKYPNLGFMYISEGDKKQIQKQMIDAEIDNENIFKYWQVQSCLEDEKFKVYTKEDIVGSKNEIIIQNINLNDPKPRFDSKYPECSYAIITALEENEMAQILPFITKLGQVANDSHLIEYGHLTSNPLKTIAYASQQATGMVDAAILATELITIFKPKLLIMAGVLGGKPNEVKIGDIIVATKTFTIDKGKLSSFGFQLESESASTDSSYITKLRREKDKITDYLRKIDISRNSGIDIHFGPIGCVRHVIDLVDFFEDRLIPIDRKTIALEMESYAISRVCELVNNRNTIPLIIKSAMDNTIDKVDDAKPYAAWTSAMFVKYILENNII